MFSYFAVGAHNLGTVVEHGPRVVAASLAAAVSYR